MMRSALLITAGIWVLCQVFGGDALGRLGIAGAPPNLPQSNPNATPPNTTKGGFPA